VKVQPPEDILFGQANESGIEISVVRIFHGIYTATTRDN